MEKENGLNFDVVNRSSYSSIPFLPKGLSPTVYKTTLIKGGKTYTGVGWTQEAADRRAYIEFTDSTMVTDDQ